jgi:hypothetical protein
MSKRFPKESDVKKEIIKLFKKHEWFYWMPPANKFGRGGISDFHAIKGGAFLALEAKNEVSDVPSALQKSFLGDILTHGGMAIVVRATTLGNFAAWLRAFDAVSLADSQGRQPSEADGTQLLQNYRIMTSDIVENKLNLQVVEGVLASSIEQVEPMSDADHAIADAAHKVRAEGNSLDESLGGDLRSPVPDAEHDGAD